VYQEKQTDDEMVDDGGNGIRSEYHVLPLPQWGMRYSTQERPKACRGRTSISKTQRGLGAADRLRRQETNLNLVPLQELDSKSSLSLSAFIRPFCSCSSGAALLETLKTLWFRISSKNLPALRHRHPRLNINSGSLPLAAALVRHLDPRSNEIALRLFLRRKPA